MPLEKRRPGDMQQGELTSDESPKPYDLIRDMSSNLTIQSENNLESNISF